MSAPARRTTPAGYPAFAVPTQGERPDEADVSSSEETIPRCPACEEVLFGAFCHACGEARRDQGRVTMRRFVRGMAHELTDMDSATIGSFVALVARPGRLTTEYLAGRRKRWLSPLRVYVLSFAAFALAFSVVPRLRFYDAERFLRQDATGSVQRSLASLAKDVGVEVPALVARWSPLYERYASGLQLLNALLFAAVCALVIRTPRRDFALHMVFAMHVMAFAFLLSVLLWPAYFFTGIEPSPQSMAVAGVYYVAMSVYVYRACRAVYGLSGRGAFVRAAVLMIGTQVATVLVMMLASQLSLAHAAFSPR